MQLAATSSRWHFSRTQQSSPWRNQSAPCVSSWHRPEAWIRLLKRPWLHHLTWGNPKPRSTFAQNTTGVWRPGITRPPLTEWQQTKHNMFNFPRCLVVWSLVGLVGKRGQNTLAILTYLLIAMFASNMANKHNYKQTCACGKGMCLAQSSTIKRGTLVLRRESADKGRPRANRGASHPLAAAKGPITLIGDGCWAQYQMETETRLIWRGGFDVSKKPVDKHSCGG